MSFFESCKSCYMTQKDTSNNNKAEMKDGYLCRAKINLNRQEDVIGESEVSGLKYVNLVGTLRSGPQKGKVFYFRVILPFALQEQNCEWDEKKKKAMSLGGDMLFKLWLSKNKLNGREKEIPEFEDLEDLDGSEIVFECKNWISEKGISYPNIKKIFFYDHDVYKNVMKYGEGFHLGGMNYQFSNEDEKKTEPPKEEVTTQEEDDIPF